MTILEEAQLAVKRFPFLRLGQAVYNAAYMRYPQLVELLRRSGLDPFYDDKKIRIFLAQFGESCDTLE